MSPTATDARARSAGSSVLLPGPDLRRQLEQRRSLRRRLVTGAMAAGLLVLVVGLVWLLTASSVLAAKQVDVTGAQRLEPDQVRQAAAVPLGVPLIRQDLDAIAARTAAVPQVAAVTVRRHWPSTVEVQVVERQPLLAIAQPDGYALVDATGVAYETRPAVPPGVLRTEADPSNSPLLVQLGVVAASLPEDLRGRVARLTSTSGGDATLVLTSGTRVHWGDADESALKAQTVAALLKRKPQAIDVSAPHNPAVR
jgi:cell division protein FtsQ